MAKFMFGMNLSLDGYVDHQALAPDRALFRHCIDRVRALTGSVYDRRMYEVMRYGDEDHPEWTLNERYFAMGWRSQPKWVVLRTLRSLGTNARLVPDEIEAVMREPKAQLAGEVDVSGPELARSLTAPVLSTSTGRTSTRRAWRRQAILRRPPAAAPPGVERLDQRAGDRADPRVAAGWFARIQRAHDAAGHIRPRRRA
jgi:hypothetical protein